MPLASDRYQEIRAAYRWEVPPDFNIAHAVCARHAGAGSRVAVFWEDESGATARGVGRGDKVAIVLPQRPQTAVAHIACYQLGAVAVPLSFLFGPDALEYRL